MNVLFKHWSWCSLFWCFTKHQHQGSWQLLYVWRYVTALGNICHPYSIFFRLMFQMIFTSLQQSLALCFIMCKCKCYMKEVATMTLTYTPSGLLCLSVTISKFPAKPLLMLLLTAVQFGKCGLRLDIHLHTGHDHGSGWWCASRAPSSFCYVM